MVELNNNNDNIIPNTTCFNEHRKHKVCCKKASCRNWLQSDDFQNCCIIAVETGPKSLEDIGALFNLTRMRICQIEKESKAKIAETIL